MAYSINNEGVGSDSLLTFTVDTTTDKDFTQDNLNNGLAACCISGNNQAGMGNTGDKLFGKVLDVSEELQSGTTVPAYCTVQARGVARFKYTSPKPVINEMVGLDGAGAVRRAAPATCAAGGHLARGMVIATDEENSTCDVWIG